MRLSFVALLSICLAPAAAFVAPGQHTSACSISSSLYATIEDQTNKVADTSALLESMKTSEGAQQWAEMFDLSDDDKRFYSLFEGIRKEILIGLKGKPFVLKKSDVEGAIGKSFEGFFTFDDLEKAVNDDFLDAGRGTTDNRKGWKVRMMPCNLVRLSS